jgi:hypothetical protein
VAALAAEAAASSANSMWSVCPMWAYDRLARTEGREGRVPQPTGPPTDP